MQNPLFRPLTPLDHASAKVKYNKKKSLMRQRLRDLDSDNDGIVTEELFRSVIIELRIPISEALIVSAMKRFGNGGNMIRYKQFMDKLHYETQRAILSNGEDQPGFRLAPDPDNHRFTQRPLTASSAGRPMSSASTRPGTAAYVPVRPRTRRQAPPGTLTASARGAAFEGRTETGDNQPGVWGLPDPKGSRPPRRPATAGSVSRSRPANRAPEDDLTAIQEKLAADRKYTTLWNAFRSQDSEETELLPVDVLRNIVEFYQQDFEISDQDIDHVIALCDIDNESQIDYNEFIDRMIRLDFPDEYSQITEIMNEVRSQNGSRAGSRAGSVAGSMRGYSRSGGRVRGHTPSVIKDLQRHLQHPLYRQYAALRRRLIKLDHNHTGRVAKVAVLELMKESDIKVGQNAVRRLMDLSDPSQVDESVDYNRFIYCLIKHKRPRVADAAAGAGPPDMRAAAATAHERESASRMSTRSNGASEAEIHNALVRLQSYFRLADEDGSGKIRPEKFMDILKLSELDLSPMQMRQLTAKYLDKVSAKVMAFKFLTEVLNGRVDFAVNPASSAPQSTGSSAWTHPGNHPGSRRKSTAAGEKSIVPSRASNQANKRAQSARSRRASRTGFHGRPQTPPTPPLFDEKESFPPDTRLEGQLRRKNPLLARQGLGVPTTYLHKVPSQKNPEYRYGKSTKSSEKMSDVIGHGYLRGHIRKKEAMLEKEKASAGYAPRFHTKASLKKMEASKAAKQRQQRMEAEAENWQSQFKMTRFRNTRARTDSGKR